MDDARVTYYAVLDYPNGRVYAKGQFSAAYHESRRFCAEMAKATYDNGYALMTAPYPLSDANVPNWTEFLRNRVNP